MSGPISGQYTRPRGETMCVDTDKGTMMVIELEGLASQGSKGGRNGTALDGRSGRLGW